MSNTDFDIAEFQARVIASISELQMIEASADRSVGVSASRDAARDEDSLEKAREKKALEKQKRMEDAEKSLGQARELIKQRSIRTTLCPALKSISSDVFDISKVVTPLLVGASLAGTIVMPLNPLLFAGIALVIARMGISSICVGYGDEKKEK